MKRIITILLCFAMAVGLMACGGGNTTADTGTLRINLASEPDHLDPALNTTVDGGTLAVNSFVGLNTFDENGKLIPALALESKASEEGTVYQFTLRESQWSNGDALTTKDFIYSWNRAANPETGADYAYLFDVIARNEDGSLQIELQDEYNMIVTLTNPCPYFLELTAFPVFLPVHQASIEAADSEGNNPGAWAQEAGFVSNGAYTLSEWVHNQSMIYEKNPYFYDVQNVSIERLEFMLSGDDTAVYAAYNSEGLDFIERVPNDEIGAVVERDDFHIVDNLGTYYIGFNVNDPIFEGKTVEEANKMRRAVSLMMDRGYIAEKIGQTGQVPADSFIPAGMSDGNGGVFHTVGDAYSYYDAESTGAEQAMEAMKLLEECGYTFTDNGDGSYSCSPAISMTYLTNEGTNHEAIAQTIQMDLATIGIDLKIAVEEWNVFLDSRRNGRFTIAREGWVADYNDPVNMLEIFTSDSGNNDMQLGKEENDFAPDWREYDALIQEIHTTTDFVNRVELMHEAEDMLMETYAVIPLYYYNDVYMQKAQVTGIYSTIYGLKYFMYAEKTV